MASLIFHVFGDIIKSSRNIPRNLSSIKSIIETDPSIVKTAIDTPLFQDIIKDLSIVRRLLLDNPAIKSLMSYNPGLREYINNDDSLRELVDTISDTSKYPDLVHLQTMVINKVEQALGNQLCFQIDDVRFSFFFYL